MRTLAYATCAAMLLHGAAALATEVAPPTPIAALRVCADPDNLPFSNEAGEGFENRIAGILAKEMALPLRYTWQSQRRGFLRRTLRAGLCDVWLGVPPGLPGVATTAPYYRSAYVFASRRELQANPLTLDDPGLAHWRIGLHAFGQEGANSPVAQALGVRGLGGNVEGFPMWGDDASGPIAGAVIDAVARRAIDVAIVWGPFAGYFGKRYGTDLVLTPILSDPRSPSFAFAFDIAVGVREDALSLRDRLQAALDHRRGEITAVLAAFAIPTLPAPSGPADP